MKKAILIVAGIIVVVLGVIFIFFLDNGGRFTQASKPVDREFLSTSNYVNFRVIETGTPNGGGEYFILVDETTGVLYFRFRSAYSASMSPLLNTDGTPKLLSDFETNTID